MGVPGVNMPSCVKHHLHNLGECDTTKVANSTNSGNLKRKYKDYTAYISSLKNKDFKKYMQVYASISFLGFVRKTKTRMTKMLPVAISTN